MCLCCGQSNRVVAFCKICENPCCEDCISDEEICQDCESDLKKVTVEVPFFGENDLHIPKYRLTQRDVLDMLQDEKPIDGDDCGG